MNEFNAYDLLDFLVQISMPYRKRGDELYLDRCPYCEQDRPTKSDHFSFNSTTGVFFCVKCQASGNLTTFKRDQGFDPFEYKVYHKPDQTKVAAFAKQPETYLEAYQKARGISVSILQRYGVGRYSDAKLGPCRTYAYIDHETGEILNVKYVNAKKQMRTESNGKRIYYGLQFVDFKKDFLHVVEGEDDCHALVSMGIENVVSVPFGAGNYSEDMGNINKKFKTIWILFDNDKAGQDGAKKFAEKAGVWKCKNVLLPFKDSRECLLHGLDIFAIESLKTLAKPFEYSPGTKVHPALSIDARLKKYEDDARANPNGLKFGYSIIDEVTGGLRGGDLFSIIANPGCFKTTELMNMLKRSIDNTEKGISIFFSLEMQAEAEFERELQIMFSCSKPTHVRSCACQNDEYWQDIKTMICKSQYNRLYVVDETWLTIEDIRKTVELTQEMTGEKCNLVGVDYLDFVSSGMSKECDAVKAIMTGLKKEIAKTLNLPVIALCQTNRDTREADSEVGTRSGKGGTAIEATSDFSIGLWQNKDDIVGRFLKHRRFNAYSFGRNPYFQLDIDLPTLTVKDMKHRSKPENMDY